MRAASSVSGELVVMISTRPSLDATPSMALRSAEREMPPGVPEDGVGGMAMVPSGRVQGSSDDRRGGRFWAWFWLAVEEETSVRLPRPAASMSGWGVSGFG